MRLLGWFGATVLVPGLLLISCTATTPPWAKTVTTPPVASAGPAQSVTMPVVVTLDGSASTSADGGTLSYAWTLKTVPTASTAALTGATTVAPTFTPDGYGFYVAQLIVSENGVASDPATVTITVSQYVSVVSNGSFESGLTGWTAALGPSNPAGTTGGWNAASPAPGTETLTATPGFPATDGTADAVGSLTQTVAGEASVVLYQDVTIPAGATTANFNAAMGEKILGGKSFGNIAVFWGLYPTSVVPSYSSARLITFSPGVYEPSVSDATLVAFPASSVNVSSQAGNTVRLAFIIGTDSTTGFGVVGVDHVVLDVLVVPTE